MTTVSAIIPCYNRAHLVAQAVASVQGQSRPVDELIVVDDDSTDDSADVARRLGARVIRLPRNSGPAAARNAGIRAARGEVVAFLDADDEWMPEHCETLLAPLERHPSALVAFSQTEYRGTRGGVVPHALDPPLPPGHPASVLMHLVPENIVPQMAAAARRRALLDAGGYDESMRHSEDYDLWLRLAIAGPFIFVPRPTVLRLAHPEQLSANGPAILRGTWRARARMRAAVHRRCAADLARAIDQALLRTWQAELDLAWSACDHRAFRILLGEAGNIAGSESLLQRWQRRDRAVWPVWSRAARLWRALPVNVRDYLRPPLRRVFERL